jgi:hypothetical protein
MRFKRNYRINPTLSADYVRWNAPSSLFFLVCLSTRGTALGLVQEPFLYVEALFTNGEDELYATVAAREPFVFK